MYTFYVSALVRRMPVNSPPLHNKIAYAQLEIDTRSARADRKGQVSVRLSPESGWN